MERTKWKGLNITLRDKVLQERIFPMLEKLGYDSKRHLDLDITIPDTDLEEPVLAVVHLDGIPRIVCDLLYRIPPDSSFDTEASLRVQMIYEIRNRYSQKAPSHAWITNGEVDFYFDYSKDEQVSILPRAADVIRELDETRQEELAQQSRLAKQQKAFYEALRELRENFHSTGRFDDANMKLDEIAKLLVMKVHEEKRRLNNEEYRFDIGYLSRIAKQKWKNEGRIAQAMRWLFEDIIADARYKNDDGTSIFGSNGSLNIQPTEDDFARKVIDRLNKVDILHFATDEDGKERELHFDVLNAAFSHFIQDNFLSNKEDAQYLTPSEAVNAMVDLAFCDIADDPFDLERILGARKERPYLIIDPTCGTGTFLVAALRRVYSLLDNHVREEGKCNQLKNIFKDYCIRGQDKVDRMVRMSKMNMIMFGDGSSNITLGNSIIPELTPGEQLEDLLGELDLIVTNPPFGAEFNVGELVPNLEIHRYPFIYDYFLRDVHEILLIAERELANHLASNPTSLQGELAEHFFNKPQEDASDAQKKAWQKGKIRLEKAIEKEQDTWKKRLDFLKKKCSGAEKNLENAKNSRVNSEIILIDRCLQLLRPRGRLVIVVPDSILFNTGIEAFLRTWIRSRAILRAVISFPTITFAQAGTLTKTSALYLQKQTKGNTHEQGKVFAAVCQDIGFDVVTDKGQKKKVVKGEKQLLAIIKAYEATRNNS